MSRRRLLIAAGLAVLVLLAAGVWWAATRTGSDGGGPAEPTAAPSGGIGSPPGTPPSTSSASPGASGAPTGWWRPSGVLSWQWQLHGKLDLGVRADVYDVDAVETSAADVAALHRAGRKVICYVNVGAYEDFRPDRGRFPAALLGKPLDGWPGERWLDIRRWDALQPILRDRFAGCRAKGFDGVEADNVDGYSNDSGFPLTADDQLAFNRRIADLAHGYGLAAGLKNDVDQADALVPSFDFAVAEECAEYGECERLRVFTASGKTVFHVEYDLSTDRFCAVTRALGFSSMRKRLDLDGWRQPC